MGSIHWKWLHGCGQLEAGKGDFRYVSGKGGTLGRLPGIIWVLPRSQSHF